MTQTDLLTASKLRRVNRNKAILADFKKMLRQGGQKMRIYTILADRYEVSLTHVQTIVREGTR